MAQDIFEIGTLLGAPVRAVQDAQISAEREYLAFLLDYGLEEVTEKVNGKEISTQRLREVEFGMRRAVSDPANPGEVVDRVATVRAPLLSLVQMPAVGISEATVDLTLDIEMEGASKTTAAPRNALLPAERAARPVLRGVIGNGTLSRNFRTTGKLAVHLSLKATHDDDLHGRLSRLIAEGMNTSITVPDTKKDR